MPRPTETIGDELAQPTVLVRKWGKQYEDEDPPYAELECTGVYGDHIQFAGEVDGVHHEIRVWFDDIPALMMYTMDQLAADRDLYHGANNRLGDEFRKYREAHGG